MLTDVVGSLLTLNANQRVVRASNIELTLPIDVRVRRLGKDLIFCADVPAWRWRTDWDPPFGTMQLTVEEARQETDE